MEPKMCDTYHIFFSMHPLLGCIIQFSTYSMAVACHVAYNVVCCRWWCNSDQGSVACKHGSQCSIACKYWNCTATLYWKRCASGRNTNAWSCWHNLLGNKPERLLPRNALCTWPSCTYMELISADHMIYSQSHTYTLSPSHCGSVY